MSEYADLIDRTTLRIERLLPGPIERVWRYLTQADKRAEWLAGGEMELRPGGRAEFIFNNSTLAAEDECPPEKYAKYGGETRFVGAIVAAEPPKLLIFDWPEESGEISRVKIELEPQGELVLLQLTHSKIDKRDILLGTAAGWHTHIAILEAKLTGGTPPPFWATHGRLETEYDKRFR